MLYMYAYIHQVSRIHLTCHILLSCIVLVTMVKQQDSTWTEKYALIANNKIEGTKCSDSSSTREGKQNYALCFIICAHDISRDLHPND